MDQHRRSLLVGLGICCLLQICVIVECRPESSVTYPAKSPVAGAPLSARRSRSIVATSRMIFPDSSEDDRPFLQMRAPLAANPPTAPATTECRPINVIRNANGTITYQYNDCQKSTSKPMDREQTLSVGTRMDQQESLGTTRRTQPEVTSRPTVDDEDDKIIFPDHERSTTEVVLHQEPKCANGQRYCTKDDSYPQSKIDQLLQRAGNIDDLLQSDVPEAPEDTDILKTRVDGPGEETFCDYESRMEYPTRALSRDEKWLPVVNHSNYTQGIRMEICRNIDKPCKMSEMFPYGFKTKCIQKYQYRQLLALHEDGQLRREYFSMPTCCLCTFSKN